MKAAAKKRRFAPSPPQSNWHLIHGRSACLIRFANRWHIVAIWFDRWLWLTVTEQWTQTRPAGYRTRQEAIAVMRRLNEYGEVSTFVRDAGEANE
jgi:hypothetical protein